MAERVGFEPTVPVRAQQFSRLPRSTTPAPLRKANGALVKGTRPATVRQGAAPNAFDPTCQADQLNFSRVSPI